MSELLAGASNRFPADWRTVSVGEAFEMQLGKMLSKAFKIGKAPLPYLANKNVQWDRVDLSNVETMDFTDSEREKFSLLPGDLLICEGGEIGRTAMWHGEMPNCYFQKAIHRLRPRTTDVLPEYMLRYMRLAATNGWLVDFMSQSSIAHLTREQFARVPICVPSPVQQRKIARILTTVDNLIEKTEALIAKYQAIKQGMMHDLFTRGVDEHCHLRPPYEEAPELYKQSEFGWIPKEWRETTVGNELLGIDAGKSPDCPDIPAPPGEWGVLKVSAVQPDGFRSAENKVVLNPVWVNPAYEVKEGDLLISRSNTYQLVGLVCLVHSPQPRLMLCDKTLRLRFNPREAAVSFMFWLFQQQVVRRHIEVHATGTSGSMKNISQPVIRSARIMLPPVEEQERITDRIEAIQDNIAAQRRTQEKLMIEKTGLMQDLLTGKVRVKADEDEEVAAHA